MHTFVNTHTLAKLCLHAGVQPQPAAGKTSANYSPRAAFAAQCSMLFDTICPEFVQFQVSLIEVFFVVVFFVIILFVPPAFHKHLHTTMILSDNLHVLQISIFEKFYFYWHIF